MGTGEAEKNKEPAFKIDKNVLIGRTVACESDYTNLGILLFDRIKCKPNLIGQVDVVTGVQDSFADMAKRTIKCALWLKKQGIRRGDIVAVCSHNHLDTFVPCVAALFVGAIFTPWDYEMNTQAARHFIRLSEPKIIFANEKSVPVLLEAAKIEVLEDAPVVVFGDYPGTISFSEILRGEDENSDEFRKFKCTEVAKPHDTATILYSSGTTGPPKGVRLSHYGLIQHLEISEGLNINDQVPLWFSGMYWISGTLLTLQSITSCTKRIVAANFDAEMTCKTIEKFQVTWLFLSTSMTNRLLKSGVITRYDLSSVSVIFTGGAPLKSDSQDELKRYLPHASIIQAYGMTECGGLIASQLPGTPSGSCGVVCRNVKLKVIDPEEPERILPVNQTGEICVKTTTMTTGYHKNPQATKSTIDEEGWLHTGDLGYYNDKGEIFILDRLKELIKYRGSHVVPGEIENVLQAHPAVLEAAVVGIPHPTDDEHPMAFVSRAPGTRVTQEELKDLVASKLMDNNQIRAGVKFLDSLPHTASGKIARKELKAMAKTLACN